jgi:DNA repair exonuclease SbcCD ATPase subunit
MEMEMNMENLEALRNIVHGLVKLSFDEEQLMKEFADLSQSDPRFNVIAQRQIKLRDDIKVIEDSLVALSKRDPFMGTIINKEVGELNSHLDNVITANKERRRPQASSEMQASMTSINNLALLLDNHFEMMMEAMKKAKSGPGKNKQKSPSLSQMQQQLNEKIQQLKGSGKSGRQLSEELAKLAAEQERIRKALKYPVILMERWNNRKQNW